MSKRFNDAERKALEDAIDELNNFLDREAERYYDHIIFRPEFPGQTPREKFEKIWGAETSMTINALQQMLWED